MALPLQRFVQRAADIHVDLRRLLEHLRDLDEKVQVFKDDAQNVVDLALGLESAASSDVDLKGNRKQAKLDALEESVNASLHEAIIVSQEKMKIAEQVYNLVDKHINALDNDLRTFDIDISAAKDALGLGEDETACGHLGLPLLPTAEEEVKRKRGKRKQTDAVQEGEQGVLASRVQAQAEPKYCICQGISYGEMIACDNPDCAIEWFHYDCVGITPETATKKGKWYCPDCKLYLQQKKARKQ